MKAIKRSATVDEDGRIVLIEKGLERGTPVEVIVLVRDSEDDFAGILKASESTLAFWDNPIDDEVWNDA